MRSEQKIEPEKITKPIQLLAAWLIGLVIVNGSFLATSSVFGQGSWERSVLVIASIANVPIFLVAMFLLQTKFRPELQEDLFYSQYLDKKSNALITVSREDRMEAELTIIRSQLLSLTNASSSKIVMEENTSGKIKAGSLGFKWKVAVNDNLDNYAEVRALLKKEHIRVSEIFGSPTTEDLPERKVLALARKVDFESKLRMIFLASQLGFDAYEYYDEEFEEDFLPQQILIGSYGPGMIPISTKLLEFLETDPDPIDLTYFESDYYPPDEVES